MTTTTSPTTAASLATLTVQDVSLDPLDYTQMSEALRSAALLNGRDLTGPETVAAWQEALSSLPGPCVVKAIRSASMSSEFFSAGLVDELARAETRERLGAHPHVDPYPPAGLTSMVWARAWQVALTRLVRPSKAEVRAEAERIAVSAARAALSAAQHDSPLALTAGR